MQTDPLPGLVPLVKLRPLTGEEASFAVSGSGFVEAAISLEARALMQHLNYSAGVFH